MKQLTPEEIQQNFEKIIFLISKFFVNERKENLLKLFNDLGERIALAPASGIAHFHNAFPGGLICHTLNVINAALKIYNIWIEMGSDVSEYTKEDLIFCALVHDLGKIGNLEEDNYIANDDAWKIKNRGEIYKQNQNIPFFDHSDRTIWLLGQYGIKMSENEFIAIYAHDGMFKEKNKSYLTHFAEEYMPKCNLVFIIHQADFMATRLEYEQYRSQKNEKPKKEDKKKKIKEIEDKFDELFPEKS